MHREDLRQTLTCYQAHLLPRSQRKFVENSSEAQILGEFFNLLDHVPSCFDHRHYIPGHCTGSALIVDPSFTRVVLHYHRKVQRWIQVGGHADGHHLMHEVALREAEEESGLRGLEFCRLSRLGDAATPLPFDLDIHEIPERMDEPAHLHFDIRYLLIATGDLTLQISPESLDLRWFTLEEIPRLTLEEGVMRQVHKLNFYNT